MLTFSAAETALRVIEEIATAEASTPRQRASVMSGSSVSGVKAPGLSDLTVLYR